MLKKINENFAYISLFIILAIIILLLINANKIDSIIIFCIIALIAIYSILHSKYYTLKKELFYSQKNLLTREERLNSSGYNATVDKNFNLTFFNDIFIKEYGLSNKTILGKNIFDIINVEPKNIIEKIEKNGKYKGVIEKIENGKKRYQSLVLKPVPCSEYEEYLVMSYDVTDSLKSDYELKEEFMIDKFTKLPTKAKLIDDIDNSPKIKLSTSTLIYICIDDFEEIHEVFGIDAGNKILLHVANWLKKKLPSKNSKLYKLDLNSFALYTTDTILLSTLQNYIKQIASDIEKESFNFKNTFISISFTIGAGRCKNDIIKCAYLALKDAKNSKKQYKIYEKKQHIEERFLKNIQINQTLKDAISENRVIPYFQPIYNFKTNEIEKFESLIRIKKRDNKLIKPAEFLDIAKKSKIYTELSKAMIRSSFEHLKKSQFPITINISAEDILDKKVSSYIVKQLKINKFGHLITFEILESEQIENTVKVSNFIKKVKSFGCKIAIDDFGSGYSNFEQILKFDVDYLKIDGSLIKNINKKKSNEIMIKSIVSFASQMGIQTVAEFVSNKEIFDSVKLLGIDYAQGYHIGKPSPFLSSST